MGIINYQFFIIILATKLYAVDVKESKITLVWRCWTKMWHLWIKRDYPNNKRHQLNFSQLQELPLNGRYWYWKIDMTSSNLWFLCFLKILSWTKMHNYKKVLFQDLFIVIHCLFAFVILVFDEYLHTFSKYYMKKK